MTARGYLRQRGATSLRVELALGSASHDRGFMEAARLWVLELVPRMSSVIYGVRRYGWAISERVAPSSRPVSSSPCAAWNSSSAASRRSSNTSESSGASAISGCQPG